MDEWSCLKIWLYKLVKSYMNIFCLAAKKKKSYSIVSCHWVSIYLDEGLLSPLKWPLSPNPDISRYPVIGLVGRKLHPDFSDLHRPSIGHPWIQR